MHAYRLLLLVLLPLLAAAASDVIVSDLKVFVNNYEFVIKGISYNPAPLGIVDDTGLCSVRLTPYSEYKSACFDSDYFDGSIQDTRIPPGPTNGWFVDAWKRDFEAMREAGINTIRVYNANPVTYTASLAYLGQYNITSATGKEHRSFLDLANSYGFKVIWPLLGDKALIQTLPTDQLQRLLQWQIDEVGDHDALIMYTVGNELPFANTSQNGQALVALVNSLIGFARNYQQTKHARSIPFTSAVIDTPRYYDWLVESLDVDVFTANAGYRGVTFSDLWTGLQTPGFSGFFNLSCATSKPLLIGEMGWHQINDAQNIQNPTWFNQLYADLLANVDHGCVGGIFFEWSDEPQKTAADQRTMGIVKYTVTSNGDGTTSIDYDSWTPDTLNRKTAQNIWTSFVSGTYNGKPYNYNSSVFDLIGRPPAIYPSFTSSPCNGSPVITGASATTSTFSTSSTTARSTSSSTRPATTGKFQNSSSTITISLMFVIAFVALVFLF